MDALGTKLRARKPPDMGIFPVFNTHTKTDVHGTLDLLIHQVESVLNTLGVTVAQKIIFQCLPLHFLGLSSSVYNLRALGSYTPESFT